MIRRRGYEVDEESSSDDEEDAFSALSKKANPKKKAKAATCKTNIADSQGSSKEKVVKNEDSSGSKSTSAVRESASQPMRTPIAITSSMKRHHKPSDARKAKMDALLQELESEKDQIPKKSRRFIPEKKGSFVEPGEEHLTSNLFVGNLAPSIAEEDLRDLFSQFGELYSVKIMWPRTMEEKNRRRNTGFVCFMNRVDAEEALHTCDETDPFNNGRLLKLRWGKNVKKVRRGEKSKPSLQKPRTESLDSHQDSNAPPESAISSDKLQERSTSNGLHDHGQQIIEKSTIPDAQKYNPEIHSGSAINVEIPTDQSRFHFISTIASYVAKDPELELRLIDEERGNIQFEFLKPILDNDDKRKEKLFYRWRVWSLCQGDTYSIWRTEPFLMFSKGRYWIPPPLDADAVEREKANIAEKERRHRQKKEDRANRELMTGRQFERRKKRGEFGSNNTNLNPKELRRFDELVRKKLSLSRRTICEAMSFCFDNCIAAKEVSGLLKEALLDESVTNDTRIARLYLLSDILFNSQQPGVRNAFMYRTTIETMATDVFRDLGGVVRRKERKSGRMTMNKVRKAVSAVLGAWTEWGVYNATFVDDLEHHFDGREIKKDIIPDLDANTEKSTELESTKDEEDVVIHGERGDWTEVSNDSKRKKKKKNNAAKDAVTKHSSQSVSEKKKKLRTADNSEIDGNHLKEDIETKRQLDTDGEGICDKELDGENLSGEDLDGEDLDEEDLAEELNSDDLDGEELDGADVDGEIFDDDDIIDEYLYDGEATQES